MPSSQVLAYDFVTDDDYIFNGIKKWDGFFKK